MRFRLFLFAAVAGIVLAVLGWLLRGGRTRSVPSKTVALDSIGAEYFTLEAPEIVRRGPSRIVVLRFSEPGDFVPYHFKRQGLSKPLAVEKWLELLRAPVVFNAGQFDDKLDHLGWMKANDEWIAKHLKPAWKGLLLSGPTAGGPWARVADLELVDPRQLVKRYRHAVQSMMLVDDAQRLRVRDTQLTACRSVLAEDKRGRVLLVLTEGATTLADLARWIPVSGLDIVRAMNLDGGVEAQLAVKTPELTTTFYGQHGTGTTVLDASPGAVIRYPLPAVIAFHPRS